MFPLVSGLSSTPSAGSNPPNASQVLHRCTTPRRRARGDYRSSLSPTGPHPSDCGRRLGLSVLARGVSIHAWGLRLRGDAVHLRYRTPPCCLPGGVTPSASRISVFGAQYPACIYPCPTLQVQPHGCPRMARGQDGSLRLSCMTLSFTTPRRFIPTLTTPERVLTGESTDEFPDLAQD